MQRLAGPAAGGAVAHAGAGAQHAVGGLQRAVRGDHLRRGFLRHPPVDQGPSLITAVASLGVNVEVLSWDNCRRIV